MYLYVSVLGADLRDDCWTGNRTGWPLVQEMRSTAAARNAGTDLERGAAGNGSWTRSRLGVRAAAAPLFINTYVIVSCKRREPGDGAPKAHERPVRRFYRDLFCAGCSSDTLLS